MNKKTWEKKGHDILQDPRFDKPLSKETARLRYDQATADSTERAVRFESVAEAKIKRAIANGSFDNLPGKGKPIDLKNYNSMPEHLRVGYQMLKNSGYLPEEVRLKKQMASIKEKLQQCTSHQEKQQLLKALSKASQQFHFHMEYNRKLRKSLF